MIKKIFLAIVMLLGSQASFAMSPCDTSSNKKMKFTLPDDQHGEVERREDQNLFAHKGSSPENQEPTHIAATVLAIRRKTI